LIFRKVMSVLNQQTVRRLQRQVTVLKQSDISSLLEKIMLSKTALDFILRLTDWFHGHWEDPEWGKRPSSQILIAIAVRDLAAGVQDVELRGQIHAAADKVIAKNSQVVQKT
jgi:hypothetical protein